MKPFIQITRHPYEEPYHLNLVIAASNGRQRGELEFYCIPEDLDKFALSLRELGRNGNRKPAVWRLGNENPEERCAYYFCLTAFLLALNSTGRCAFEIRLNNNQPSPDAEISQFSIEMTLGDLDQLANLLSAFSALNHRNLYWSSSEAKLS